METRKSWGIVYMAAVFAILAIGVAYGTYYFEKKQKDAEVAAVSRNFADWQSISDTVGTSSPGVAAPSDALSEDLLTGYYGLLQQGTFTATEKNQMLADVVKKNIQPQNIVPIINLTDLSIKNGASVDTYMKLMRVILSQSAQVKENEVDVFARTVTNETKTGTLELQQDAFLYQRIAAAMLLVDVPPTLANQHLAMVKSVGALAKAVANMGTWSGDPIEALTDADAFNKAEAYVKNSVNDLLATAAKLQKKS